MKKPLNTECPYEGVECVGCEWWTFDSEGNEYCEKPARVEKEK